MMDGPASGEGVPRDDGDPKRATEAGGDVSPWLEELRRLVAQVEMTAREWGIRPDSREGQFVSALLGTTGWLGRLSLSAQASVETVAREYREASALELARVRELTRAAELSLSQARNALISLEVEHQNVVVRMMKETLPLFAEKLKGALVLREKSWNGGVKRRRYAVAALFTLGLFLGGYALRTWEDWDATGGLEQCLAHQLQARGHIYCDVTWLADVVPPKQ